MICPITRESFKDPVLASDGHTYERDTVPTWLVRSKKSPLTMKVLDNSILNSNISVRKMSTTLAARTPEEVETINNQEDFNINIQPETILEGHALRRKLVNPCVPVRRTIAHAARTHEPILPGSPISLPFVRMQII